MNISLISLVEADRGGTMAVVRFSARLDGGDNVAWGFFYCTSISTACSAPPIIMVSSTVCGQHDEVAFNIRWPRPCRALQIGRIDGSLQGNDWTGRYPVLDPFCRADGDTGAPWGARQGEQRRRCQCGRAPLKAMVWRLPGDTPCAATKSSFPINRSFADVPQDKPVGSCRAGLRTRGLRVQPFRLFVAISNVTWNPSVCFGRQGQSLLPDVGRIHSACRTWQ